MLLFPCRIEVKGDGSGDGSAADCCCRGAGSQGIIQSLRRASGQLFEHGVRDPVHLRGRSILNQVPMTGILSSARALVVS